MKGTAITWARMITMVYQVDTLVCVGFGQRMSVLAFVTDRLSISRILDTSAFPRRSTTSPRPSREPAGRREW